MKKVFNFSILFLLFSVIIFSFQACVDQEFDEPPRDGGVTDYETNSTIAQLKAIHSGFDITQISDDIVIGGIVTADDASGNFYKELVMEDETGAIKLSLEFTDFNNEYPIGRQIWVNCKGLFMDFYQDSYEIGGSIDNEGRLVGIEENLVNDFVVKGPREQFLTPTVGKISDFGLGDVNRLITLENVELIDGETGVVFADAVNLSSVNRNLEDCFGSSILLRTSGFADFAGELTPELNGNLTGILGAWNGDLQMFIRDLNDVSTMTGDRCDGIIINPPPSGDCDVEEDFTGGTAFDPISETGWTNVAVVGNDTWIYRDFSDDFFAHMQSYQSPDPANEAWLVSPSIDLSTQKILNFETETAFWAHDGLTVWVSTDFSGNVETATWDQLNPTLAGSSNDNYERVPSGDVSLPVGGTGHVAFRYVGDAAANTSTYRVDNVFICKP